MEFTVTDLFLIFILVIRELIKGLSTKCGFYSTLSMTLYHYIIHDSSTSWEEFLKSMFKFSHLLIRALIKGLSPVNYERILYAFSG